MENEKCVFVVFGASGDLARNKIYPTLWRLYRDRQFNKEVYFLGFSRTRLNIEEYLYSSCDMQVNPDEQELFRSFIKLNSYLTGFYDKEESFHALSAKIAEISNDSDGNTSCNRIFYLALPPSVYESVLKNLSLFCKAPKYEKNLTI